MKGHPYGNYDRRFNKLLPTFAAYVPIMFLVHLKPYKAHDLDRNCAPGNPTRRNIES